ncbi:MAG TPA: SET domain-containing protein-lysine N-methyltransferase [Steroidobacteraceae bacterium]
MSAARGKPQVRLIEVRESRLHGFGVFAARRIAKGARVVEYLGERVTHAEADRRYDHKDAGDNHTFLFIVDAHTVIDAGVGGNEARFVNHSCEPNCESVIVRRRVFIHALRHVEAGEELFYDYWYVTDDGYAIEDLRRIYPCRCRALGCRGTRARPPRRPKRRAIA